MTGNHHNTPSPYPPRNRGPDLTPIGLRYHGAGDKPQFNRFDRLERLTRQLVWLAAINLALTAALLVALILDG